MKQLIWLMLLVIPFLSKAQKYNESGGIQWTTNLTWEQIKQKAKEEDKFIFVDAYATWCSPCKKMDKEVYADKHVGDVVNKDFISVKVQMDSTGKDNIKIKSWYPVVKFLNSYGIDGYPSLLFFTPDGKLAYKEMGYYDVQGFIAVAKDALTDPNTRYANNITKFKNGQLPFAQMPVLAREAWYKKKDKEIANIIAQKYKTEYADNLNDERAYTKENLYFLAEFYSNIGLRSNDRYFKFFYNNPELADSIIGCIRFGRNVKMVPNVINGTIRKEEITERLYYDGKNIRDSKPNWKRIQNSIKNKYGKQYVKKFFPDEQIQFYKKAGDWIHYVECVNKKIKDFPPKANGNLFGDQFGDAWQLNVYAWDIFEGCNEKKTLAEALPWIDLSLKFQELHQYLDTKANILYKLGRKDEAITIEEKAVALSSGYLETLNKMKAGLPTWPMK